jgi:ATP-dependent RNA helicase RhlB
MKKFFKQVITKIQKLARPEVKIKADPGKKLNKEKISADKSKPKSLSSGNESGSFHRRAERKKGKKDYREKYARSPETGSAARGQWKVSHFNVPPAEGKTRFHDFDLPDSLLHAIYDMGFSYCTPVQAEILPSTLTGKDAFGRAQTGTGKTAAFLVAVITRIINNPIRGKRRAGTPRVLILAPTRELVLQITEEASQLGKYCNLKMASVFGGMNFEKQKKQLAGLPVDIAVATPGRLLDFQRRNIISLKKVEVLIIDEADRMLDMGFIPDVKKIIYSTPPKEKRQTLLFSATLTDAISRLASHWTLQPVTVEIEPEQVAVDTVDQVVYIVTSSQKFALLYNIINLQDLKRVLIFCNRRDEVSRLAEMLTRYGINCAVLSGDVPQEKRVRRLTDFKAGKIRVLVGTDVVARGIHIDGMDHVINFTLPHNPEDYVHRIGRTGRAGAVGTSISFADEEDAFYIPDIEEFMGRKLPCIEPEEDWAIMPKPVPANKNQKKRKTYHKAKKASYKKTESNTGNRSKRKPSPRRPKPSAKVTIGTR